MDDKCISFASHAIGLDHKKPYKRHGKLFYRPYRNYYDASIKDCEVWDLMVKAGYAKAGRKDRRGGYRRKYSGSCYCWKTGKQIP